MSIQTPERVEPSEVDPVLGPREGPALGGGAGAVIDEPGVNPSLVALATFLATAAAGWLFGGIFQGFLPRLVGVFGAFIGTASVALSFRSRRPSVVQYLGVFVAVIAGALLVLPDAGGGSANLPGLVLEAIRSGGIGNPPVAFLPGWRFVLVVFPALFGGGAAAVAVALRRPKAGVFLPVPLIIGAALLQPSDAPVALTAIAVALLPAAITVSHGADLAKEGSTSGRFEIRRLGRSAGLLSLMMIALVILGQLGLLFPKQQDNRVIPPTRPEPPPPQADRVIFTVASDRQVTWRLGVLDVYDGRGWLLPPFDLARFRRIPPGGVVPGGRTGPSSTESPTTAAPIPGRETYQATFEVHDVQGQVLPVLASPRVVQHRGFALDFDPRTQALRLPDDRAAKGMTYTVEAPVPPNGAELMQAPPAPEALAPFLDVPPAPEVVVTLLGAAPATNMYDRLQYVRNAYFEKVVAAGAGKPVDVPPTKVVGMLAGQDATPFEITAGEVLLARWAGIPARIGYGYFGGERTSPETNVFEIRPKHGATWLEAYFEGHGWVPLVGIPPKAKASLSEKEKQENPDVRPSENLAMSAYVPVQVQSLQLIFELARYWLARAVPLGAAVALVLGFYPGVVKAVRRRLRRGWASSRWPLAGLLVAYAELRDQANDLNLFDTVGSPIEFVAAVEADAEHEELAWLATRALWGDLWRDLRPEEAELAAEMAQSVARRLRRSQPAITRILAFGSRASLRDPYSGEIPNLWPRWATARTVVPVDDVVSRRSVGRIEALQRRLFTRRTAMRAGAAAVVVAVAAAAIISSGSSDQRPLAGPLLPRELAPAELAGLRLEREPALEEGVKKVGRTSVLDEGIIFSIREGDTVQGMLQVSSFKPDLIASDEDIDDVREGVIEGLGSGNFTVERAGDDVLLVQRRPEQTFYLWFAPDMTYFQLLIADKDFSGGKTVLASVLAHQRGEDAASAAATASTSIEEVDQRRGGVR